MPFLTAQFNPVQTVKALDGRKRGFKESFGEFMDDAGRLIAVSLATSTQPYGISPQSKLAGEAAVRRDIYRIYCTPGMVYHEIVMNSDIGGAKAFYKAFRLGDYSTALGLIRGLAPKFSLVQIGGFDGGALHKTRRNKRGRVPPSQKHIMLVTNPVALQKYVSFEMNKVGFGKAGWANCSKAFKEGRAATRGLPGWVTRHKTAPASVLKEVTPERIIVTMQNGVRMRPIY